MRLRCWFLGCEIGDLPFEGHCCHMCDTDLYAGNFLQSGCALVEFARRLRFKWRESRYYRSHKCDVCGDPMRFTEEHCCSAECYDQWIPF